MLAQQLFFDLENIDSYIENDIDIDVYNFVRQEIEQMMQEELKENQ
jgi:hypothetical protein